MRAAARFGDGDTAMRSVGLHASRPRAARAAALLPALPAALCMLLGTVGAQAQRLSVQPIADQTAGTAFAVEVRVVDGGNNPVNVTSNTTIELTVEVGTGVLGGTTTGVILAGTDRVTINGLRYDKAESGIELRATAIIGDLLTPALSNAFTVSPGPAYQLVFTTQPANPTTAGANLLPAVTIRDAYGNTVTTDNRTITLGFAANPGGAVLNGTTSLLTVNGVATWTGGEALNITVVATGYKLRASHSGAVFAGGSDTVDSATFDITPAAAHHLAFTTQPVNTAAGAALVPVVAIQDQYNNTVTGDNRTITLSFAANPGGGTLGGVNALTTTSGVATWLSGHNLNIAAAASGYRLRATGSGLFGGSAVVDSNAFNITPTGLHHFDVTAGPNPVTVGQAVTLTITARDIHGNALPSYTTTSPITLSTNTGGPGSNLSYTNGPGPLVDHHDGTATIGTGPVFDGAGELRVDVTNQRAETVTVTVSDGVVNNGTVLVSWAPDATLHNLLLQALSTSVVANNATMLTLTARDLFNNPIPNYTTTAIITISTNTGGDGSNLDYGSANPHFTDNGATATFSSGTVFNSDGQVTLTLTNRRAEAVTITASDGVAANGSANVTWTPAAALLLEIQTIPAQVAGSPFDVTIHVTDQFHNLADVVADTGIQLQVAAGTGTLGGTTTGSIAAGTHSVTITGVTYDRAENGVMLLTQRTSGDFLVAGTSNAFNVTGAAPAKLAFNPAVLGNQIAGHAFPVTIEALDALNNVSVVPVDTNVVLSVFAGSGALIGDTTGTISAGTGSVTIPAVKYNRAEGNVVLRVSRTSGPALAPGDCAPFTVAADVATRLAIEPVSTQAANIAFAVVVDVLDDYDNPSGVIAATTLQLDLVAGTGTLGGTLARTISPGGRSATFSVTYDMAEAGVRLRARATAGDVLAEALSNPFTVNANMPVRLRFDPIGPQVAGTPFAVTVRAVDAADNTASVIVDTVVTLGRNTGRGLVAGTISGTIVAGTSGVTIAGATYDTAESGVSLSATCTSGENLASATSNLFSVAAGVGVALRFVSQPTNTDVLTPLTVSIEIIDALGNRTTATIPVTLSLVDVAGCGGALSGTTPSTPLTDWRRSPRLRASWSGKFAAVISCGRLPQVWACSIPSRSTSAPA